MQRKILGICVALVAFAAFAFVPALASASPALTDEGKLLEVGKLVKLEGEETSEFASSFITVTCNDFWLTGPLATNTGSQIKGNITKVSFNNKNASTGLTEDCSSGFGATLVTVPGVEAGTEKWCLNAGGELAADKGIVEPHACGGSGGAFKFTLKITSTGVVCNYERTSNLEGTFTTNTTPATLKLEGNPKFKVGAGSGFGCTEGELKKLNVKAFTDETTVGLTIS